MASSAGLPVAYRLCGGEIHSVELALLSVPEAEPCQTSDNACAGEAKDNDSCCDSSLSSATAGTASGDVPCNHCTDEEEQVAASSCCKTELHTVYLPTISVALKVSVYQTLVNQCIATFPVLQEHLVDACAPADSRVLHALNSFSPPYNSDRVVLYRRLLI